MNGTRGNEVQFGRAGRATGAWLTGTGLLAAHVSAYLLAGIGLLLLNLLQSPTDLWVGRPLLLWAIVLIAHAVLVGAGRVTRRATKQIPTGLTRPRWAGARQPVADVPTDHAARAVIPIRARFRPTPMTPPADERPAIRPLTTRSRDIATHGAALATRASRFLAVQGRDLWDRRAREVLTSAGSRLKDVTRQVGNLNANQTGTMSHEEHRSDRAERQPRTLLLERKDAPEKVKPAGPLQMPTPGVNATGQPSVAVAAAAAPAPVRVGAAEVPPSAGMPTTDEGAPEGAPSPWGPLPSWARIRPNGSDEGTLGPSALPGRSRLSPINARSRPTMSESEPGLPLSARRENEGDDVVIDEAPLITKETEWTWMEAAAASWLARRERQDRLEPGQNAPAAPVEEMQVDPERLHA